MSDPITNVYFWLKSKIEKYRLVENVLLATTLITANFAVYVAYFDMNVLLVIDSTTVAKHVLGMTITYVLISGAFSVFTILIQSALPRFREPKLSFLGKEIYRIEFSITLKESMDALRETTHDLIGYRYLRIAVSVSIFSVLHIGALNSALVFAVCSVYIFVIVLYRKNKDRIDKRTSEKIADETLSRPKPSAAERLASIRKAPEPNEKYFIVRYFKRFEYAINLGAESLAPSFGAAQNSGVFAFLASKVGVLLILLALALGIGRANYVGNNVLVKLNQEVERRALFMTTAAGVGLFDREKKLVEFVAWDNIERMEFDAKKRRSFWSKSFDE